MVSQRGKSSGLAEFVQKKGSARWEKLKKFTTTYCRKCDGLCIGQCFEVYHSKLNYWE